MAVDGQPQVEAILDTVSPASATLKGRTVSVVHSLSREEQWLLYNKTRELKATIKSGGDMCNFRINDPEVSVYSIFMEDSTRTKESFRNAAQFHRLKLNMFDAQTSSFQKNETITDTIKMLVGYSVGQTIFIIRSKLEGVCTWLSEAMTDFARARGLPQPAFVNAGDGRHEHPSQEFLDEFSFLEHQQWNTSRIHIALLGDLCNGRTVHSKVEGLRIYSEVHVDLIAPEDLALPTMYYDRMISAGYTVRKFASIADYLAQERRAAIWYFTRLQLERMGDRVLNRSVELRKAVTFRQEFVDLLPSGTKFFHPLPRDARHPTIPFWLDSTPLNGWDQQSQNGYFTRIVLLGMLGGLFTEGPGRPITEPHSIQTAPSSASDAALTESMSENRDFVREIPVGPTEELRSAKMGFSPIADGLVVDYIAEGRSIGEIWQLVYIVHATLGLDVGGHGVLRSEETPERVCGLISLPTFDDTQWERLPLEKLAALAPGSTFNLVRGGKIFKKVQVQLPPRVCGFPDISCKNAACISHPSSMQHEVKPCFLRNASGGTAWSHSSQKAFVCKFCEHLYDFWQIWDCRECTNILACP